MINHKFPQPFAPVSGKVVTSSHYGDLKQLAGSVSVGLYDAKTWSVATNNGNGSEFFIGVSNTHTKDKLDRFIFGQTNPYKSMTFRGKDVISFEYSLPSRPRAEVWTVGYNGSKGCNEKNFNFECGKAYGLRIMATGSPTFRNWAKQLTHEVWTDPICCTENECTNCPDGKVDCERIVKELSNKITNHPELSQLGFKARYITNKFTSTVSNIDKYCLSVCDNGSTSDLAAIQAVVGSLGVVERSSRSGSISSYTVYSLSQPTAFTPSQSVAYSVCGTCPSGYTTVASVDVYQVTRPIDGSDNLANATVQQTYATAVATEYSGSNAKFLSQNGSVAVIEFTLSAGTASPTALKSDSVVKERTVEAQCVPSSVTPITWSDCGDAYKGKRALCLNLTRKDCSPSAGDRQAEVLAIVSANPTYVSGSLSVTAGDNCVDSYSIEQWSNNVGTDGCLSKDTFTYDQMPGVDGSIWTEVEEAPSEYDATKKCGLEITAETAYRFFSDCAFEIDDYYEMDPIRIEIAWIVNEISGIPSNCGMKNLPQPIKVKNGEFGRQSGEWVLREFVKDQVYRAFGEDTNSPRYREVMDSNLRAQVDRKAYYKIYYLTYKVKRGEINFDQESEVCEGIFLVKDGDQKAFQLESAFLGPLSKFGVSLTERK